MGEMMSINTERIFPALNEISVRIQDIETRNKKFLALIEETNQRTDGKFALMKALQTKVEEEAVNITGSVQAVEEVEQALQKHIELAEEADDASVFM